MVNLSRTGPINCSMGSVRGDHCRYQRPIGVLQGSGARVPGSCRRGRIGNQAGQVKGLTSRAPVAPRCDVLRVTKIRS